MLALCRETSVHHDDVSRLYKKVGTPHVIPHCTKIVDKWVPMYTVCANMGACRQMDVLVSVSAQRGGNPTLREQGDTVVVGLKLV